MNWLDEYEAKLKAATKGVWAWRDMYEQGLESEHGMVITACGDDATFVEVNNPADKEFIAFAHNEMVAKLIAAVRMAEGYLKSISDGAYYDSYTMMYEVYLAAEKALDRLQSGEFGEGE